MPRIRFLPSDTSVDVAVGTFLADACRRVGFALSLPCGGKGLCGKCRVRLLSPAPPPDAAQTACLTPALLAQGWRAACVFAVETDLEVADLVAAPTTTVLREFTAREPTGPSGWWRRKLRLAPPTAADARDDHSRLLAALPGARPLPSPLLRSLPDLLRNNDFSCRAAGHGQTVFQLDPPAPVPAEPLLGLAVDLGTTTLAAALCDLETGAVLATVSRANPQSAFGDDVISRVTHAAKGQHHLNDLSRLAVAAIEAMAAEAVAAADCTRPPLIVTVAGNTVMNHLLLAVPPTGVAASPFAPAFVETPPVPGRELGWQGEAPPLFDIVPSIAGFVGGDITAGMVAHDMGRRTDTCLLLDVGTNGEMVLAHRGRLLAAAAAAGPAFEGARIAVGMRAARGAISRVGLGVDGGLDIGVVDGPCPAIGLCGTGLLDTVAALLDAGILTADGRLLDPEAAYTAGGRTAALAARLFAAEGGAGFWLVRPAGRGVAGVALTQQDVREFQLAKGAVAAGVRVLLAAAGIGADEVETVLLAGGFGNYLDPVTALRTGLLPKGIDARRVRSVGNAALAGARLCLCSDRDRREAARLARRVEYVELSGRRDFEAAFAEEMLFSPALPGLR